MPVRRLIADDLGGLVPGKAAEHLVVTGSHGQLLHDGNVDRDALDPAVRAVRLAEFTPRGFRDTAAGFAVSAPRSVEAVQRSLDHGSAATTLDVCGGLFANDLDRVAEHLREAALIARRQAHRPPPNGSGQW